MVTGLPAFHFIKIAIEKANLNINNTPITLTGTVDENVNIDKSDYNNENEWN